MKLILLIFCFSAFLLSCNKKEEVEKYNTSESYNLSDVSYGGGNLQNMDIYLPENRSNSSTKVFVLVHGGAWSSGDKAELDELFNNMKNQYPDYAVVNLNYRLGTENSPGYQKQIVDIQNALTHLQQEKYSISDQYFMIGVSAGAHLSLLYGYAFDTDKNVKGICNLVGPTDFTDPVYQNNVFLPEMIKALVGSASYQENPELYEEVSPAKRVTSASPKTISFYGDSDILVHPSQRLLLHNKLDSLGIYNESTLYPGEGHGGWNQTNTTDFTLKLTAFVENHF